MYFKNDIEIFSNESIQIIVQEHWEAWSRKNFWLLGFPIGLTIFFFTVWSNILLVNHTRIDSTFMIVWEVCTVALASYFVILQFV